MTTTKTKITDLLGIKYPILQGGMAWIAESTLAAAVSNAGGLGIIAGGSAPIDYLRDQIRRCKSLTDKPFGVNIMLMSPNAEDLAQLVIDEKVPVVTTGAGNPGKFMAKWKEAGIKVIPVVPSVALAKRMERAGADAVVAEGTESGGHIGENTTMCLVPQVVDGVSIPVIAAGGIADGRGIAASFMLGAEGVQLGTRFMLATECSINPTYKEKLIKANDTATIVTGKRLGHPVRSLKSPFSRAYAKAEYSQISDDELEAMAVGSLRAAVLDGDEKKGCFLAGQIAGMINKEQSAAEMIEEIFSEAEAILNGAKKWVK